MTYMTEDYYDSYNEGFSDGYVSGCFDFEFDCENPCIDENHYDVFYEGYLQGTLDGNADNSISKPNVVIGVQCCTADEEQSCVQIRDKVALTISEAAAYSNVGQNRIEKLLKTPNCPFALFVGTKKLVKRVEFEKFISQTLEL